MGLALVGAFAAASAVRSDWWARLITASLLALFLLVQAPYSAWACKWWYLRSQRVKGVVMGAIAARMALPGKTLVLAGVDETIFDGAFRDHAFQCFGVPDVYVDPAERETLTASSVVENEDASPFFLDPADLRRGLLEHRLAVFSAGGTVLLDVTAQFEEQAQSMPALSLSRVDLASALIADSLRGDWYQPEGNHRWMGRQAGVVMAGPASPEQQLYLAGYCPGAQLAAEPLVGRVLVDGQVVGQLRITRGDTGFEAAFHLPATLVGKPSMEVTVQLERTFHAAGDSRDLGLTFGSIEVR